MQNTKLPKSLLINRKKTSEQINAGLFYVVNSTNRKSGNQEEVEKQFNNSLLLSKHESFFSLFKCEVFHS